MKKIRINLMTKFTVFAVLCLAIIVSVIGISTMLSVSAAEDQAKYDLNDMLFAYSEIVDEYLQNKSAYVSGLSKNEQIINYFENPAMYEESTSNFLSEEYKAANGVYEGMFLGNYETGKIVLDGMGGNVIGIDLTKFPFFEGTKNKKLHIDQVVYRSPATNRLVFVIAAPVFNKAGTRLGLVSTSIEWEVFLEQRINKYKVGLTGYIYMLDKEGQFIAHPDKEKYLTNINKFDFADKIMKGKNGFIKTKNDGTMFISFREIEKSGWIIAATVFEKELIAGAAKAAVTSVFIGAVLFIIIAVFFVFFVSMIVKNVKKLTYNSKEIADGNLDVTTDITSNDELGDLGNSFNRMVDELKNKASLLEKISDKDLTIDVKMTSENDGLGLSLKRMKESMNEILVQVNTAVDQVASGAQQVALSSQSLSQGATEQASSLEEISSSIVEISSQVQRNTENAQEANSLSKESMNNAQEGNKQMKDLVTAMNMINSSSDKIKKIVKTIDDIAFQINLLALNANVEAARAGKYGKGFAVVAEEVRNLAIRSADAVKETTSMVEESISNINQGNNLVDQTAKQLEKIADSASKVAGLVEEITNAGKEQSEGLTQISTGLTQIDQVTQSNTAGAEESASASEELASMAKQLKQMIAQFKLETQSGIKSVKNEKTIEAEKLILHGKNIQSLTDKRHPDKEKKVALKRVIDPSKVIALDDNDFAGF